MWWVLTPEDDLFPERIGLPALLSFARVSDRGVGVRASAVGASAHWDRVYGFTQGVPLRSRFLELQHEAEKQRRLHPCHLRAYKDQSNAPSIVEQRRLVPPFLLERRHLKAHRSEREEERKEKRDGGRWGAGGGGKM